MVPTIAVTAAAGTTSTVTALTLKCYDGLVATKGPGFTWVDNHLASAAVESAKMSDTGSPEKYLVVTAAVLLGSG